MGVLQESKNDAKMRDLDVHHFGCTSSKMLISNNFNMFGWSNVIVYLLLGKLDITCHQRNPRLTDLGYIDDEQLKLCLFLAPTEAGAVGGGVSWCP